MENQALKNKQCSICGECLNDYLFFAPDYISGETFGVFKCYKCGIAATEFDLNIGLFEKYYPKSYYGKRKSFTDRWINKTRLKKINYVKKNILTKQGKEVVNSILDVGCGDGSFIFLLANSGWKVSGTEMALEGVHANNLASEFICRKEFTDCNFESASFDVVTMWHTLEHFFEPMKYLAEVGRVLKKDGIVVIEVPNFDSWQAKIFKKNWFHLDVPRHVFHYDKNSLDFILKRTGFKIIKTSYLSFIYSFFGLLQSLLNMMCNKKNFLFDMINRKVGMVDLIKNYKDTVFTLFFSIPIFFLVLPFFLFESVFEKGSIITVWAKKV